MLNKGCILVMVVRSIHRTLTWPLSTAALWLTAINVAAPIPLYALGARKINATRLSIATEPVTMLFMFSASPTCRIFYS